MMGAKEAASVDVDDSASSALQSQISALKQAENLQRQRAAPPQTRAERIQNWKKQGFSEDQAHYMGDLLDFPEVTHAAVMKARQAGPIDENSQQFHDAVRAHFQLLQGVDPADITLDGEAPERANEFPDPTATPAPKRRRHVEDEFDEPQPRTRSSIVSAPVSHESFANGSYNSHGERPGQVHMTVAMKEAAKLSGITEKEYAENVLRLRSEKANGRYGGEP
jgi:hypothetical protein